MEQLEGLDILECPFTWGFLEFSDHYNRFLEDENRQIDHDGLDESDVCISHMRFKTQIIRSFESYRHGEYMEALSCLEIADSIEYDKFMNKFEKCFNHLSKACRIFVMLKLGLSKDAEKLLCEIRNTSYSDFDEAGFLYLKSSLSIRYGKQGSEKCIELMKKALEIIGDEPTFHNHIGVVMCRIRHYDYQPLPPSHEEIFHLRRAIYYDSDNPWFSIDLARDYMEMTYGQLSKEERSDATDLAINLFRDALKQSERLTGNNLARCIYFIMKLKNEPDLEKYAIMAKKRSNSILVNHYIGLYYLRNNKLEEAYECFEEACKVLPFLTGLTLLMKYRMNNDYIDDASIEKYLVDIETKFQDKEDLMMLYLSLSEFFLLVQDDFKKATILFKEFLDINPDLSMERHLTLTRKFKKIDYIKLLAKQLCQYKGSDHEILNVKGCVVALLNEQKIKFSVSPRLDSIKDSLY